MNERTYRVHYIANDGTRLSFYFTTDRSFSTYRNKNYDTPTLGTPFRFAMLEKANEISQKPESSMARHGGFSETRIRMIECIETKKKTCFAA